MEQDWDDTPSFASKGQQPWPPLYHDTKRLENIVDQEIWPDDLLMKRVIWYKSFIETEKSLMPRGKANAERNLAHFEFELQCRMGYYSLKDFDNE